MTQRTISVIILVVVFGAIAVILFVPKRVESDGSIKLGKPKTDSPEPKEEETAAVEEK